MCTGDIEHLRHLFVECSFAQECWQNVGLVYDMGEVETAAEWLIDRLSGDTEDNLVKIATVLWGVWFTRNKRIFEGKHMSPAVTMVWSLKQIAEWRIANKKCQVAAGLITNEFQRSQRWQPPTMRTFKINVDASVKEGQNSLAVGIVLRNSQGHFLAGRTMRFIGSVQVVEAEMIGIAEALSWLALIPVAELQIESDSQLCVKAINGECVNLLEHGVLVQQCKLMIQSRGGVLVGFLRKRANKVAHMMTKIPRELNNLIFSLLHLSCWRHYCQTV